MKRQPVYGICKLCLTEQRLLRSHLIPKAVYAMCRADDAPNPNPIMVTDKLAMQTSRQFADHLLCFSCEQLLRAKGEDWMIPRLATYGGSFPLGELLASVTPAFTEPDFLAYALSGFPDIDTDAIIHFGTGIFWKSSVHSWDGDKTEPRTNLAAHAEGVRKFLLGESKFPAGVALSLLIQPKPVKQINFEFPLESPNPPARMLSFYILGVQYTLWLEPGIPHEITVGSLDSPTRVIIVTDIQEFVKNRFADAIRSAHKPATFLASLQKLRPKT
jgi:hypothetical protein